MSVNSASEHNSSDMSDSDLDLSHGRPLLAEVGPDGRGEGRWSSDFPTSPNIYIRQAAEIVGVSPASLRMWEQYGLIQPKRSSSGYRIYSLADINRLREIHRLRSDGVNSAGALLMLQDTLSPQTNGQTQNHSESKRNHSLGDRVRALRKRKGLSLRQLAEHSGLSPSFVSSLERSLNSPSVASLQRLAAALDSDVPALLGSARSASVSPVVRHGERQPVLEGGVAIEDLSVANSDLEPLVMTIEPGASSDGSYSHAGEEFLFLLEGTLHMTLDGIEEYALTRGDSMTFSSMRPHQWINKGHTPTTIVWVNTPRTF